MNIFYARKIRKERQETLHAMFKGVVGKGKTQRPQRARDGKGRTRRPR